MESATYLSLMILLSAFIAGLLLVSFLLFSPILTARFVDLKYILCTNEAFSFMGLEDLKVYRGPMFKV